MSTGAQVAVLDARGVAPDARALGGDGSRAASGAAASRSAGSRCTGRCGGGRCSAPLRPGGMLGLFAVAVLIAGAGPALRSLQQAARDRWPRRVGDHRDLPARGDPALAGCATCGSPSPPIADRRRDCRRSRARSCPTTASTSRCGLVIVLGAGVLLIDAGLMVAFAPRPISELRRAGAALPLVVLAIVPSTLVAPAARLPARAGPVRAAGGIRVGRASAALRRAARDRPRGARRGGGDDRRAGARPAHAVAQLRGARRDAVARTRRDVRLVPALRADQLAAHRSRGARRAGEAPGLLEGAGSRPVQRHRLDPGIRPAGSRSSRRRRIRRSSRNGPRRSPSRSARCARST